MAIQTPRMNALQNLANQLPVANQQVATGLNEARKTQMQAQIGQAAPTSNITAASQVAGTAGQAAAGQIQMNAAQQTQNNMQQVEQMGLQEQSRGIRQVAHEQGIQESQLSRQLSDQLAGIDSKAKKQILDSNLNFKMDEAGKALLNTQQLVDWSVMNAKSDQDFQNKMQDIQQASDRKLQMMDMAYKKLQQIAKQGYYSNKQQLDNATRQKIAERAQAIQAKIEREKAKAAAILSGAQGAGTVIGMGVGAFFGGPAGAMAGGSLGGGAGTLIGSQIK